MKFFRFSVGENKFFSRIVSGFAWSLLLLLGLSVSLLKELIFPEYFFTDQITISELIRLGAGFETGSSYSSIAAFYSLFGVHESSVALSLFSYAVIVVSFYYAIKSSGVYAVDYATGLLLVFFVTLSCVYMTVLSKDFVVALVFLPFLFLCRNGYKGIFVWVVVAVFYALWFRTYWFIFVAQFLFLLFVFRRGFGISKLIFSALILLLAWALVFSVVLGVDLDVYRTLVNDSRLERGQENARTMIVPYLSGGGFFVSWLNTLITFVLLLLPLPLLLLLSPYYVFVFVCVGYMWWGICVSALKLSSRDLELQDSACLSLIFSFVLTQSLFEPDYGSYIRHLAPLFPIVTYILCRRRF